MIDYSDAIIKDRVPLKTIDKVMLFLNPLLPLTCGSAFLCAVLVNENRQPNNAFNLGLTFSLACLAFGVYLIYLSRQKLKFSFLASNQSQKEKEVIIAEVAKELKWALDSKHYGYFRFSDYGNFLRSSSIVSILFNDEGYYVNVLDSKWRPLDFGSSRNMSNNILDAIMRTTMH